MDFPKYFSTYDNFRIGDIALIKKGRLSVKTASLYNKGSVPFIQGKEISSETLYCGNLNLSPEYFNKDSLELVPKLSLVISISGNAVGNVAKLGNDAIVDNNVFYLLIDTDIVIADFLYFYLYHKRSCIIKTSRYALRVSLKLLTQLAINIPPVHVQYKIVEDIRNELHPANAFVHVLEEKLKKVNKQRNTLVNRFINDEDIAGKDIVSRFFRLVTVNECGCVKTGNTPSSSIKQYFGDEFPLYTPENIGQRAEIPVPKKRLSERGLQEARPFRENAILVCFNGIHFGRAGIAKIAGACNAQMIFISPGKKFIAEYLYYEIMSDHFQQQMREKSNDCKISKFHFGSLLIRLPSIDQQVEAVKKMNTKLFRYDHLIVDLNKQLREAKNHKETIFNSFFGS